MVNKLSETQLAELTAYLDQHGIFHEAGDMAGYRSDASFLTLGDPALAVYIKTEAQAVTLLEYAHKNKLPLYLRAAGSSTAGASLGPAGSVLVITDRLNNLDAFGNMADAPKVAIVDPAGAEVPLTGLVGRGNLYARVPAGLSTFELDRFLKPFKYQTAVVPSSGWSTIAGNYATNAGGNGTPMYGTFKDIVSRIRFVTIYPEGVKTLGITDKKELVALGGLQGIFGIITELDVLIIPIAPPEDALNVVVTFEADEIVTVGERVGAFMVAMEKVCKPYIAEFLFADQALVSPNSPAEVKTFLAKTRANKIILLYNGRKAGLKEIFTVVKQYEGFVIAEISAAIFANLLAIRKSATGKSADRISVPGCEDVYVMNPLKFGVVLQKMFALTAGELPGRPIGHQYTGGIIIHYRPQARMTKHDLTLAQTINQRLNDELFKPEYETIKGHEHGLGLELMTHGDKNLVEKVKRVKQQYDPLNLFNPHLLQPPAPAAFISDQFTCVSP